MRWTHRSKCAGVTLIAWIVCVAPVATACGFSVVGANDPGVTGTDLDASKPNPPSPGDAGGSGADAANEPTDAGMDQETAAAPGVALVQSAHASKMVNTLAATLGAPTKVGNLVVVLVTYSNTSAPVLNITDNAPGLSNLYANANLRSASGSCRASEIWFARNVRAGATTVTATMTGTSGAQHIWVMEASGLAAVGGLDKGLTASGSATTTITAPTVQATGTPAFFAAAVASCGTIGAIAPGNAFIALPPEEGNSAAYHIATMSPGPVGPVYMNSNDSWNASVAAFR